MRLNVGTEFVAAEKHLPTEQRVAFALEVKLFWQPIQVVAVLLHPFGKERLLTGAFFVAEITGDEFPTNSQPGVGGENHVRQSRLRRNQMNLAIQFGKRRVQLFPLLLSKRRV